MTSYRFVIEYRDDDGQRRRVVYQPSLNGIRWSRREEKYEDGRWIQRQVQRVSAPKLDARPTGAEVFTGP